MNELNSLNIGSNTLYGVEIQSFANILPTAAFDVLGLV